MAKNIDKERRQHKRYRMKNRIFAVICSGMHQLDAITSMSKGEIALAVIKSKPPRMGEIVEISLDGLSFHHIENDIDISQFSEMDILYADDDFHLSRLPFRTVKETALEGDAPFDVLAMKRLTVKFGGLTAEQKGQLDHLLENYTLRKAGKLIGKQVWGSRS